MQPLDSIDFKPANRRSRTCECMPIPAPQTCLILLVSCPVRGASRGDPEVGQSESWPEGQPEGRCGARGCVSQTQTRGALGNRPCPIRGAAFNGWTGQAKGGRKPAWMASLLAPAPGRTGPRDEEVAAMERPKGAFCTTKARFSALHLPSKRGDQLKAQLARRRGNAKPWLFEIRIGNFRTMRTHTPPSSRRTPGPIRSVVMMRKV